MSSTHFLIIFFCFPHHTGPTPLGEDDANYGVWNSLTATRHHVGFRFVDFKDPAWCLCGAHITTGRLVEYRPLVIRSPHKHQTRSLKSTKRNPTWRSLPELACCQTVSNSHHLLFPPEEKTNPPPRLAGGPYVRPSVGYQDSSVLFSNFVVVGCVW